MITATFDPAVWKLVPIEPSPEHLHSMALRYDHGLGCPGYYDQEFLRQEGLTHAQRLEGAITTMRQLYEEATGEGFFKLPAALTAAPVQQAGQSEPMITYTHRNDIAGSTRYRQYAKDPVPGWAVDVQPDTTPTSTQAAASGELTDSAIIGIAAESDVFGTIPQVIAFARAIIAATSTTVADQVRDAALEEAAKLMNPCNDEGTFGELYADAIRALKSDAKL